MAINFENNTIDFFVWIGEDKENFIKFLIDKQLIIAFYMASIYGNRNILHVHAIWMDAVKGSQIPKILPQWLNGQMTFGDVSIIFITALDKYFKSFFCLALKLSKNWLKIKKFWKRSKLQPQPRIKKKKLTIKLSPLGKKNYLIRWLRRSWTRWSMTWWFPNLCSREHWPGPSMEGKIKKQLEKFIIAEFIKEFEFLF